MRKTTVQSDAPLSGSQPLSWTPFVKAGLAVTRGKEGTRTGTAGVIVRKVGASTGAHLMTCAHVLGMPEQRADDNLVFSPAFQNFCGIDCNEPIGTVDAATLEKHEPEVEPLTNLRYVQAQQVIGAETFAVDAALVALVANINSYNNVPEIGTIPEARDLISEWGLSDAVQSDLLLPAARQLRVRKFGSTTHSTAGRILRLARRPVREYASASDAGVDSSGLVFEVEPDPATEPIVVEHVLNMEFYRAKLGNAAKPADVAALYADAQTTATPGGSADNPTLKLSTLTFAVPGDSGAPIVDDANRVVGLLYSSDFKRLFVKEGAPVLVSTGLTQGIFVAAAFQKLGVGFLAGGQHAAGARVLVPGMVIDDGRGRVDWTAVGGAAARFKSLPGFARLSHALQPHVHEIRSLVHSRRRVTVTWHRSKGPGFLAALMRASQQPGTPTPLRVGGVTLADAIRAMQAVLIAEGSPRLRAAIAGSADELLATLDAQSGAALEPAE